MQPNRPKKGKRTKLSNKAEDFVPKNRRKNNYNFKDHFDNTINIYYGRGKFQSRFRPNIC